MMGARGSRFSGETSSRPTRGRKRRADGDGSDSENFGQPSKIRKVRIPETGDFIYKTLFKEGVGSDVCVQAGEREWRLHRLYLNQSPFFQALFNGGWKDSSSGVVTLSMIDPKVTVEALDVVLGSMYSGEVTFETGSVTAVAAACRMLQLEALLAKCGEIMMQSLGAKTAVPYHEAALDYGLLTVESAALTWLAHNLFPLEDGCWEDLRSSFRLLRQVPIELLEMVTSHVDLVIAPSELFLYSVVACWIYMDFQQLAECACEEPLKLMFNAAEFFRRRRGEPFVLTPEGQRYAQVVKALRIRQLVMVPTDIDCLRRDNIVDPADISSAVSDRWERQLYLALPQNTGGALNRRATVNGQPPSQDGPSQVPRDEPWLTMDPDKFYKEAFRFGKRVYRSGYVWRWTGYLYGVKLTMRLFRNILEIAYKDEVDTQATFDPATAVEHCERRYLTYRMRLFKNRDGDLEPFANTGIKSEELWNVERSVSWEPRHFERESFFPFPCVVIMDVAICRRDELHESPYSSTRPTPQSDVSVLLST